MRKLYVIGGPRFSRSLDRILESASAPEERTGESLFGSIDNRIEVSVGELKEKGFAVLPFQLPESCVESLTRLATEAECIRIGGTPGNGQFSTQDPLAPRYNVPEQRLVRDTLVCQLAADPLFIEIARRYLGSPPVNDLITMWWNIAFPNVNKSVIAQEYHYDLDRTRFLKFFFYLTDVTPETGPHCFVEGSHVEKPTALRDDRRFTDAEVFSQYPKSNERVFTGKRGMILAEDTAGFHKGMELLKGVRLMFQLEYATNLFGTKYLSLRKSDLPPGQRSIFEGRPGVFRRFLE